MMDKLIVLLVALPLLKVLTLPEKLPLTAPVPVGWHLAKLRLTLSGVDSLPKLGANQGQQQISTHR